MPAVQCDNQTGVLPLVASIDRLGLTGDENRKRQFGSTLTQA